MSRPDTPTSPLSLLLAGLCGSLFGLGLVLAGMTQPAKVLGFLNLGGLLQPQVFGAWDPSLAFVMGGAVLVTLAGFAGTLRPGRSPWLTARFHLPTRHDITPRLVLGSALFGTGWGLAGYCPGPALASVLTGGSDVLIFTGAMLVGIVLARRWTE